MIDAPHPRVAKAPSGGPTLRFPRFELGQGSVVAVGVTVAVSVGVAVGVFVLVGVGVNVLVGVGV
jgi:hypothetical protein